MVCPMCVLLCVEEASQRPPTPVGHVPGRQHFLQQSSPKNASTKKKAARVIREGILAFHGATKAARSGMKQQRVSKLVYCVSTVAYSGTVPSSLSGQSLQQAPDIVFFSLLY